MYYYSYPLPLSSQISRNYSANVLANGIVMVAIVLTNYTLLIKARYVIHKRLCHIQLETNNVRGKKYDSVY